MPRFALVAPLAAVLCLALALPALAGGGPSPESCEDLGLIEVECRDCSSGQVLGKVTVQGEYAPGNDDCLKRAPEAERACKRAYDLGGQDLGYRAQYSIGITKYTVTWPGRCSF